MSTLDQDYFFKGCNSEEQPESGNVNHPNHYNQGSIECIDALLSAYGPSAVSDFCLCNAFKYLWRCRNKNAFSDDLGKAKWYIDKALELTNSSKQ